MLSWILKCPKGYFEKLGLGTQFNLRFQRHKSLLSCRSFKTRDNDVGVKMWIHKAGALWQVLNLPQKPTASIFRTLYFLNVSDNFSKHQTEDYDRPRFGEEPRNGGNEGLGLCTINDRRDVCRLLILWSSNSPTQTCKCSCCCGGLQVNEPTCGGAGA